MPFSSMIGSPAKPSCVVPSMITASVIGGRAVVGAMVCRPAPGISKMIRSGPPMLPVLFAASMASCSEMRPSPPMSLRSAVMDEVSPSTVFCSVVTTSTLRATTAMLNRLPVDTLPAPSSTLNMKKSDAVNESSWT